MLIDHSANCNMWFRRVQEIHEVEPPKVVPLPKHWSKPAQFGEKAFSGVSFGPAAPKRKLEDHDGEDGDYTRFKRVRMISRQQRLKLPKLFNGSASFKAFGDLKRDAIWLNPRAVIPVSGSGSEQDTTSGRISKDEIPVMDEATPSLLSLSAYELFHLVQPPRSLPSTLDRVSPNAAELAEGIVAEYAGKEVAISGDNHADDAKYQEWTTVDYVREEIIDSTHVKGVFREKNYGEAFKYQEATRSRAWGKTNLPEAANPGDAARYQDSTRDFGEYKTSDADDDATIESAPMHFESYYRAPKTQTATFVRPPDCFVPPSSRFVRYSGLDERIQIPKSQWGYFSTLEKGLQWLITKEVHPEDLIPGRVSNNNTLGDPWAPQYAVQCRPFDVPDLTILDKSLFTWVTYKSIGKRDYTSTKNVTFLDKTTFADLWYLNEDCPAYLVLPYVLSEHREHHELDPWGRSFSLYLVEDDSGNGKGRRLGPFEKPILLLRELEIYVASPMLAFKETTYSFIV